MSAQTLLFPGRKSENPVPRMRVQVADTLRQGGALDDDGVAAARAFAAEREVTFPRAVVALRLVADDTLYPLLAQHYGVRRIDPVAHPVDPRLTDRLGLDLCLQEGIIPWRDTGGMTIILAPLPEVYDRLRPQLQACFGPTVFALAPERAITMALLEARGPILATRAQSLTPDLYSCRHWNSSAVQEPVLLALILLVGFTILWPGAVLAAATIWAIMSLILCMALKAAAAIAAHRQALPAPPPPLIARLPDVSIIVALYREADIAERLVERLSRLDYPRDKLEILLAIEERDTLTRDALERAALPEWMRLAIVPHGKLKTKPRALNHALGLCRGSIIGIFDAEDAPAPDQIRRMVDRFHATPAEVACLQGVLDYYNPRTNWIARCFTIEYATLFRIILPGIQRMGLAIPLGGTTLYVRREALEKVGAWDAHNVTEDADLGLRLARFGYRTEVVNTVTHEEANCMPVAWVKQRSRWQKGYMMTWFVHMRAPMRLRAEIGARAFWGFQIMFFCALSQAILAPVLWSYWLLALGWSHPVTNALPTWTVIALVAMFLMTEAINITIGILAIRKTGHRMNPLWVPTLIFYFPLATLSVYKALWEMVRAPFYWDKTTHGHFG
ncbi:glycosyltransferase [Falsirhodobacter halotolerans]|uniref:glycosyltransferase n=1 Tax=Falsirhodobacter halotolerans TaxID=1146892 RepID=UPI001FD61D2C|nr:glycosyltransferase [Falsirhodobacter halotolerans]MCJ8140236.1 glycosyltransferase [Falsirhodobacter halotolerans]